MVEAVVGVEAVAVVEGVELLCSYVVLVVVVYSVVDLVEVLLWVVPFEEVSVALVYFVVDGTDDIAGAVALVVVVLIVEQYDDLHVPDLIGQI